MKVHLMPREVARHLTPNPSCQIISFDQKLQCDHIISITLPALEQWAEGVDWTPLVESLMKARSRGVSDLVLAGDHPASAHVMAAITAAGLGTAYTWGPMLGTSIAPTKALASLKIRLTLEIA